MSRTQRGVLYLVVSMLTLVLPGAGSAQITIAARGASLTIGGRLHTQFQTSSVDTAASNFFFRRARLQVDIRVNDFVDGRLEPEFAPGRTPLADAWARLTFDPAFAVSIGQFKRAFSLIDLMSANDVPIIERDGNIPGQRCPGVSGVCSYSRLTQQLQFDGRDIGLRFEGTPFDGFTYMLTLANGQGANASDVNDAKSPSLRLEYRVAENLRFGVFGAAHDYPDTVLAVVDTEWGPGYGADFEIGDFREAFHLVVGAASGNNWKISPDADFFTVQGMATHYFVVGEPMLAGVEPLLRVSWADPNDELDDEAGLLVTPGLMLYFQGRNGLAANLDRYSPDGVMPSAWSLRVQMYLYF